jgi:hypothetical protein
MQRFDDILSVSISAAQKAELREVAEEEDRSLACTARHLMLAGLASRKQAGRSSTFRMSLPSDTQGLAKEEPSREGREGR